MGARTDRGENVTRCPHCNEGRWLATDGRVCPTCEGAGVLSPERIDQLLSKARFDRQHAMSERRKAVRETQRLRAIVEDELGAGSARRDLVGVIEHFKAIIRQMGARIEELKAGADPTAVRASEMARRRQCHGNTLSCTPYGDHDNERCDFPQSRRFDPARKP